jgi:hypothetical protein
MKATLWATQRTVAPTGGGGPDLRNTLWDHIHTQIAADCRARADMYADEHNGRGLYVDGRDWMVDAYQEVVDMTTYLLMYRHEHPDADVDSMTSLAEYLACSILTFLSALKKDV